MNKLKLLLRNNQRIIPVLVVCAAIILSGSAAYAFSPQGPFSEKHSETPEKTLSYKAKPTQAVSPTPKVSNTPENTVLGSKTRTITPRVQTATPTQTAKQGSTGETTSNSSSQSTSTGGSHNNNQQETPTATPAQATQEQTQAATVSVTINAPDGSSSFTVEHNEGMTVCDVLQKAKDTGKIKSVTFDDSYMASLKSKYVAEINGHPNNWTFTVNGSQPLGCSLANPKPNDTIVWKFG